MSMHRIYTSEYREVLEEPPRISHLSPDVYFCPLAQGSQAVCLGWQTTTNLEHADARAASEHLWAGTAPGRTESELYLCFQTRKENQEQPKRQQMTLEVRMQFYLPRKQVNIRHLAVRMPDGLFQASVDQTEGFRQTRDKYMAVFITRS